MQILETRDNADWQAPTAAFAGTWTNIDAYINPTTHDAALVPLSSGTLVPVKYEGYNLVAGSFATASGGSAWLVRNRYTITEQVGDYLDFPVPTGTIYVDVVTAGAIVPNMVGAGFDWTPYEDGVAGQDATTGPLQLNQIRAGAVMELFIDGVSTILNTTNTETLNVRRVIFDGGAGHTLRIKNHGPSFGQTESILTLVGLATTAGSGAATDLTWTSPLYDGGDTSAVWIGADWEQAGVGALLSVVLGLGNTTDPTDGTWQTWTVPISETVPNPLTIATTPFLQESIPHGRVGFLMPSGDGTTIVRARYAQVTLTLAAALTTPTVNGSTVPWVRRLAVYTTIPEQEILSLLRLPPILRGPKILARTLTQAAVLAKVLADVRELTASASVVQARGPWLQQIGSQLGIAQAPGERQADYATRLQAASVALGLGAGAAFIVAQVSAYLGAAATITSYGAVGTAWQWTITLPTSWPNPVTRAQVTTLINTLNPSGNIVTIV